MIIAALAAVVGFAAFWANPSRLVNRGFFAGSLSVALWLFCLERTLTVGGAFWGNATSIAGAAIILPVWFIKEAIVGEGEPPSRIILRARWWIIALVVLGLIRTTPWIISDVNLSFWVFVVGMVSLYGILIVQTLREMRSQVGLKRIELQIAAFGSCATALTVMLLLVVRVAADLWWVMRLLPLVVLLFYTATVVAITTSRVFNARQLLLFAAEKLLLILTVATAAFVAQRLLEQILPAALALCGTTALALWLATAVSTAFDRVLHLYPQATTARQAAFTVAQRETRIEKLEEAFRGILNGWGQTDHGVIVAGAGENLSGKGVDANFSLPVARAMRHLRWVTPERLARERLTQERAVVGSFLTANGLGALVLAEGPSFTALVGVGTPASRRPFTYPQITQLLELASIMESALERAHFSAKAQHAEQLATVGLMGASLAHEIRNPLVTIKSFVQLLPHHHDDPVFREKFFRLIGDEVNRIDQLTEQLLEMASPRNYSAELIELHAVLRSSLDLVAAKASHKRVLILTELAAAPDQVFTDASAAKQVMLNLCFNALQAVEASDNTDPWVKVSTRNTSNGIELAVADNGPGIPPEIRPRLFQPFRTTKSTGFGLGLAICSDILANLNASITVDPPRSGGGAVFRVTFPCRPLSS